MKYYLHIAFLQLMCGVALHALHAKCSESSVGVYDLNEVDKRNQWDTMKWITFCESLLIVIMKMPKYSTAAVACVAFFLIVRLNHKGILNSCMRTEKCPMDAGTEFDFEDYCVDSRSYEFKHTRFWANPRELCPVPEYYSECRNPVDSGLEVHLPFMRLKNIPDLYQCYVWGCSNEITPVRFGLKWCTTLLSIASIVLACAIDPTAEIGMLYKKMM